MVEQHLHEGVIPTLGKILAPFVTSQRDNFHKYMFYAPTWKMEHAREVMDFSNFWGVYWVHRLLIENIDKVPVIFPSCGTFKWAGAVHPSMQIG